MDNQRQEYEQGNRVEDCQMAVRRDDHSRGDTFDNLSS